MRKRDVLTLACVVLTLSAAAHKRADAATRAPLDTCAWDGDCHSVCGFEAEDCGHNAPPGCTPEGVCVEESPCSFPAEYHYRCGADYT